MNLTDVDDKIITRSESEPGSTITEVTVAGRRHLPRRTESISASWMPRSYPKGD